MMRVNLYYSKSLHPVTTMEYIILKFLCSGATSYRCQNSTSIIEIGGESPIESTTLIGNNIVYSHAKLFAIFCSNTSRIFVVANHFKQLNILYNKTQS